MTPEQRENAFRKIRGIPTLPIKKEKTHDWYGIKIVKDIPTEWAFDEAKTIVTNVEKEKPHFRQEIFPNSYVDVMNGNFGGFYKKLGSRELQLQDYQNRVKMTIDGEGSSVGDFSNYSKRIYYLDKQNSIRLISIETGSNVNEGESMYNTELSPLSYTKMDFYVKDDTLKSVHIIEAIQNINKAYDEFIEPIDIDTTIVEVVKRFNYYYKENCFRSEVGKGEFPSNGWKESSYKLLAEKAESCDNSYAAYV